MDKHGNNNNRFFEPNYNFLLDNDFIMWRLLQTQELNEYWENIIKDNTDLRESIEKSIEEFEAVKINWKELPVDEKDHIYKTVVSNIERFKRRRLIRRVSAITAILIIAVFGSLFIKQYIDSQPNVLDDTETIFGETLPEEEIYLISKGEKISIVQESHLGVKTDGKALITDSTNLSKELLLGEVDLNRLVVPYGKRMNLTLSDGTKVWLNSGTQLDFPTKFKNNKREIYVNGEIFIDVAHKPEAPFFVKAKDMSIRVVGTSFNISAFNDDISKTVVLVDGNIEIETTDSRKTYLVPNEKFEIYGDSIIKEMVDVSEYVSWTNGILKFDEITVYELLKKLGRYYNVQFESSPDIKLNDNILSGKLFLSNNLDSVLTSVSILSSTDYKRENNTIRITKK